MQTKKWYQSKTMWFNLIMLVLSVVTMVDDSLLSAIGIDPAEKARLLGYVAVITAIGNKILRLFFTDSQISIGASTPTAATT